MIPEYIPLNPYETPDDFKPDYHAVYTVLLCELIDGGLIDFSKDEWDFDYYDVEQRNRLWKKFEARFYWREIGIEPYKRWKWELLRKLNEIMPKYKPAYKALDDGQNIFQTYSEYGKSRNIYSDFPQTLLGGNQDYATNGTDRQHEEVYLGNWMEQIAKLKTYDDIDIMILNELETFFITMFTSNLNGY